MYQMFKVCVFFSCDIDNCYCDICNDLVVYCVGLAYDVSLSQMIDNKVDSHLKKLLNCLYCYYQFIKYILALPIMDMVGY